MDDRLSIELILETPEIVTPIGLTVDDEDNLYVLESHTHSQAKDYAGPKYDRIKKGVDNDGDARPDKWIIYADSINDGMNIFWDKETIYLAEKDSIFSLKDTDGDGIADERKVLVQMLSPGGARVYDHAGLMGVVIGPDDWLYISRGNAGGMDLTFVGADGSTFDSYGEGGNIMRCRPDGSQLEEIARGFWNPFDIKFTASGNLMAIENDPDSRGPNKLLDIVPGGEYGYHSMYGSSGIHPYLSWNGELPGTLPYAAGIGEAPSGLIDASYTNFPEEYKGQILATIWEENSIVNVPLAPYYSSVKGVAKVLVKGDSSFHPVSLATNSRGDLYISDWVVREYPNHGHGRIWLVSSGRNEPITNSPPKSNEYLSMLEKTYEFEELKSMLQTEDRFQQAVARKLLATDKYFDDLVSLSRNENPQLRMQALLTLTSMEKELGKNALVTLLNDSDSEIRRMTMIYIGKHLRRDLYGDLIGALKKGLITSELFETYLATLPFLQPDFIKKFKARSEIIAKNIKATLPENYILSIIQDETLSDEIRATVLPYLDHPAEEVDFLLSMFKTESLAIKKALFQVFKKINNEQASQEILKIVTDENIDAQTRALGLVSLEFQTTRFCEEIAGVLSSQSEVLVEEAARYLIRCRGNSELVNSIEKALSSRPKALAIWEHSGGKISKDRPTNDAEWRASIDGKGDIKKGMIVFQSSKAQCQQCHTINKWGGIFGPALSNIGSSKSLEQILTAILEPSAEISPEWQGWYIKDQEGTTHYGRQIDVGGKNAELMLADGEFVNFKRPQDYGMSPTSLMPDGLEMQLTRDELNDLVNYLVSLD